MKTIGLLGGMSWESSVAYYTIINQQVNKKLGGHNSAKIILNSLDFAPLLSLQAKGDWDTLERILVSESKKLELSGVDVLLICTNTLHKCFDAISKALVIPLIHIADATGKKIEEQSITKIGLLGTSFTMQQNFYKHRLVEKFDLEVVVPNKPAMDQVNTIIYEELVFGITSHASKETILEIIAQLEIQGAQGIVLGCTELPLLITQEDIQFPVFDTTNIHAEAAVKYALS